MLNLIDTTEYDNWWVQLNTVESNLKMSKTSKSNKDLLIDVQDYSVLINSINTIKNNDYGKYYKDWSNYPVEQIEKGKVVKEQRIGELLTNLVNNLCGNTVSESGLPTLQSKYSVENIQEDCYHGYYDCSYNSTTNCNNSGGCGNTIDEPETYGITTKNGTDTMGCITACNTGEFLAHGQHGNYGQYKQCSGHDATVKSTYGQTITGDGDKITERYYNRTTYTGYSVNI